ncbi:hypothetical protein FA15DRAFT_674098 [Coprinopsis marcescibilis]|uniref:Uncharacterized protein n=1 Tax=Coprinopsis marcescibilis TaxID=230819 RepID=A0A5C3KHY7_COPMA|nr:hypothetical protein FA15DRAFT_674098 [Coprinopsis marcescibilis]
MRIKSPGATLRAVKKLLTLLYLPLPCSFITFVLSLLHLGTSSLFLSPIASAFTLVFCTTFVILTHKDLKNIRSNVGNTSTKGYSQVQPPDYESFEDSVAKSEQRPHEIAYISRLPSIISACFLVVLWISAFGLNVYTLSRLGLLKRVDLDQASSSILDRSIGIIAAETFFIGILGSLMIAIVVLGIMQRNMSE